MQWFLLISPFESSTNEWEILLFPDEEATKLDILNRDLTKEYYCGTLPELASAMNHMNDD